MRKTTVLILREWIPKEKEKTYYELKFPVPENICCIEIEYVYKRYRRKSEEAEAIQDEVNIIDLALRNTEGRCVGASGSERSGIRISAWKSTPGYQKTDTRAGEWAIIVGAYKIEESGVEVTFTVTLTRKEYTLLKGDTHIHTLESDGCMTIQETVEAAAKMGLDYLFITDHNNYVQNTALPDRDGITVIPGVEWTHYAGHAGMLGLQQPFESAFCVNSKEEAWNKLEEGRRNGCILVVNHPFCPYCGWQLDLEKHNYDVLELVNGSVGTEANRDCLCWWQEQLCKGRILPIVGGSDFHGFENGHRIGLPSTCLYALSPAPVDILTAITRGNGYIAIQPEGPSVWTKAAGKILGETVPEGSECSICFTGLLGGDTIHLINDKGMEMITCEDDLCRMELKRSYPKARFVRFEVLRGGQQILISNPVYFR